MDRSVLQKKVLLALDMLLSNDYYLLEHDLSERTIAHKLANYLQILFFEYNVDFEYNRMIDISNERDTKTKKIGVIQAEYEKAKGKIFDKKVDEIHVIPDIIVHKRGDVKNNLIAVEVKKTTNTDKQERKFDNFKIERYTYIEGGPVDYFYGVFVDIGCDGHEDLYKVVWYSKGKVEPKQKETLDYHQLKNKNSFTDNGVL